MLEFNEKNTAELINELNENVDWIIKDRANQISNRKNNRKITALETKRILINKNKLKLK